MIELFQGGSDLDISHVPPAGCQRKLTKVARELLDSDWVRLWENILEIQEYFYAPFDCAFIHISAKLGAHTSDGKLWLE